MRYIALFLLLISVCFSPSPAFPTDGQLDFAKSLTAKDYDDNLPPIQIDQWLKSITPAHFDIQWGNYITACGEQSGNPQLDTDRDLPLCAEVSITENNKTKAYLLLFIGTEKKGNLKESANLYYGFINTNDEQTTIKKLRELKNIN